MFTDDILEQLYQESKEGWWKEALKVVNNTMISDNATPAVAIKRADNIWRLFAKRHPDEIRQDGFANVLLQCAKDDKQRDEIKRILNMK